MTPKEKNETEKLKFEQKYQKELSRPDHQSTIFGTKAVKKPQPKQMMVLEPLKNGSAYISPARNNIEQEFIP